MNKLKFSRIKTIRDGMSDCLVKLDRVSNVISNSKDNNVIEDYTSAFRHYIIDYNELLFSCVYQICRSLGTNYIDSKNIKGIYKCVSAKYLSVNDKNFYMLLCNYGINASCRYNHPDTKELIEFYDKYKISLSQLVKDLDFLLEGSRRKRTLSEQKLN